MQRVSMFYSDAKVDNTQPIDDIIKHLSPYKASLSKEEKKLAPAMKMCYGKHAFEDFSQEGHILCQSYFQRKKTYEQVLAILEFLKLGSFSLLDPKHLLLIEIFKAQYPTANEMLSTLQLQLAEKMQFELKEIQTEAKLILDSPIEDGARPALTKLSQEIDELPNKKMRLAFVCGSKSPASSIFKFMKDEIYHQKNDVLTSMIFDFARKR